MANNNKTTTLRKLKLQVQMSVDGYIAGPNGEMDWMVWNWDDKLKEYVNELTETVLTPFSWDEKWQRALFHIGQM
jgi:hypothetical protein